MSKVANEGRTIATIAYITFIGTFIAFSMNLEKKNSFARFHIRQMFGLIILLMLSMAFYRVNELLGDITWVISFLCWAMGLYGAITKKELAVPLIGPLFQRWFTFVQ